MRNHTCLFDHHQMILIDDTITIGPEGMMNWALQLNNSQSANSFSSLVEEASTCKIIQTYPTKTQIQSVIDRGNLRSTEDVFVVEGETSRSHEIDEKRLHEELGSSD